MRMAAVAVHKPNVTSDDLREFEIASKGARFLFDQNLEDYCNKLRTEAIGIVFDNKKLNHLPVGDERTKIAKILEARLLWFNDQLEKEILKRFGPFLRIRG